MRLFLSVFGCSDEGFIDWGRINVVEAEIQQVGITEKQKEKYENQPSIMLGSLSITPTVFRRRQTQEKMRHGAGNIICLSNVFFINLKILIWAA
jgi:aminoglycoside phosphotransferase family enzyme